MLRCNLLLLAIVAVNSQKVAPNVTVECQQGVKGMLTSITDIYNNQKDSQLLPTLLDTLLANTK